MSNPKELTKITNAVQDWFKKEARDLPWRQNKSPYSVWVSEIMLQQTQVVKVIDYFNRFMGRFSTITELANASEDEVLSYWTGLGYYSRCRNLHKAAKKMLTEHGGEFPSEPEHIAALPGIGSYTSGAIRSFAFNQVAPVVDGNIARVLSRLYADQTDSLSPKGKKHFEHLSLELAKVASHPAVFHEGIMELGAIVCKPRSPLCELCPLQKTCKAHRDGSEENFPIKAKKAERTELHAVFAVLGDDEHLWLERNEKSRLFGNLYAPPHMILDDPSAEPKALGILATKFDFRPDTAKKISLTRQLTHRNFHMHGYVIKASPQELPHGKWMKREDVSKVGLSSAVKALLEKAQLLCLLVFLVSGCATHKQVVRKKTIDESALPGPPEAVPEKSEQAAVDGKLREKLVKAALDAVGSKQIKVKGNTFRRDCSGTVRGIFAKAGLTLKGAKSNARQSDSKTLMDYAEEIGEVSQDEPEVGDLVFFRNTYGSSRNSKQDDNISHIGIVTKVLNEDEVFYVHYGSGRIKESDMSEQLRRHRRGIKAKTGIELFAGYGKFNLNDLIASDL